MDRNITRQELITQINSMNDAMLSKVSNFIKSETSDLMSLMPDEVKSSIDKGLNDVKNGNVHSHESVMSEMKSKFGLE